MHSISSPRINLVRLAISILLVMAIALGFWFATPEPAQAITVTITNPASGYLGSAYSFTVLISVQDVDRLPIQSVDLRIYNAASPGTYTAIYTGLPLPTLPNSSLSSTVSNAGGTATITGTSGAQWGSGTAARFRTGYGYVSHTTANVSLGTTFGYGYGYAGNIGATSITYTINWVSPASWPTGTYNIDALAYGTTGSIATAVSNSTPSQFILGVIPPAGGGVPPATTPAPVEGTTDVTDSISPDGVFTEPVTVTSTDTTVTVSIPQDTVGLQSDGSPLTEITVVPVTTEPPPPPAKNVIGIPIDLGPDGATFVPPITVTLTYDPASLPEGVAPEDLVIAYYDTATGTWVELTGIVIDPATNTIRGQASHFTAFAVISPQAVEPEPTTPAPTTPAPTTPTPTIPAPTTSAPTAPAPPAPTGAVIAAPTETGTVILPPAVPAEEKEVNWLWPIIGGVITLIAMGFVVWYGWNMRRD